jgi:hypothetical protein
MPTTQDYMPSVQIPDHAQTPLTIMVRNGHTWDIEKGMTYRAIPQTMATGKLELSVNTLLQALGDHGMAVTSVNGVSGGGLGEFYCGGIYPARLNITSTDVEYRWAWLENAPAAATAGQLNTELLGEFYVHGNTWEVEVEGEATENWGYVERMPSMGTTSTSGVLPHVAHWSGPAEITSGSVGGKYSWEFAYEGSSGWQGASGALTGANTDTAWNLAETSTTGYTASVPNSSIPSGWAPLPTRGIVIMNVTFFQGTYRAWFYSQSQFSGPCS